jgi:protoporphyrinogen oxidase
MLGMTLALRLSAQGHRVTIMEAAGHTGGLAAPKEIGDYTWDRFYHVILLSDQHLLGLLEELGLGGDLHWGETRTGFYVKGKSYSLSSSLDFLAFPPLSLAGKARLALTILYASCLRDGRRLEGVLATDWLRRWSGDRTFERIWLPLLKSKLGKNYEVASAAFIWATIARMYAARRSGLKREMFGYVDGGYDRIITRLQAVLQERHVRILTSCPVQEVHGNRGGAEVALAGGVALRFDKAILTVPASRIGALCPQLPEVERRRLGKVVYQGVICAALLLRNPLDGFYVTNITDAWVPFTGVIEMTALVDRRRFGGNALVYLPRYLTQDDPLWRRKDREIGEEFLSALERMYPQFCREDVLSLDVSRAREVLAVSTLRYSDEALPPTRTSLEHVFVVNAAQIANGTLNNNEVVALANQAAQGLAPQLVAAPQSRSLSRAS